MISALRKFTATTQTFWGCDETDTGGVLGVRVDGVDFTGDTLTSATDYTGLVTATGLSEGTHTYQMLLDESPVGSSYTFTTAPAAGDEFSILFFGDTTSEADTAFNAIIAREDGVACAVGSELYYLDNSGIFGGTATDDGNFFNLTTAFPASEAAFRASINSQYRTALTTDSEAAGRNNLYNTWPVFNSPGNHDLYKSNGVGHQPGVCIYDACFNAAMNYVQNGMPDADGIVDSVPSTPLYYNFTVGDVEVVVLDGISYSDPFAVGSLGKDSHVTNACTAGDNAQEAWFQSVVTNSTANAIIVLNSTMINGASSNWSQTLLAWMDGVKTATPIIFVAPDTHQSFARYFDNTMSSAPIFEVGCSPTGAVTSSKNYGSNETNYASDLFSSVTTVNGTVTGVTLTVHDTSVFRATGKVSQGLGGVVTGITSIDSATQMTMATSRTWTDGEPIYSVDWPSATDIQTDTIGKRRANYVKITRHPNGSHHDANAHTEVQIIGTFTGHVKFRCRIRDGERIPRFYNSVGKQTTGAI